MRIAYPLVALLAAAGSTLVVASPAQAHGYVSSPPSRQALCASGAVPNCGPIQFEPQSVEGPKGLRSCDGGLAQFAVLADESRSWPAKTVGSTVSFSWVLTARHRTSTWDYFVGGSKVASFDDGGAQPASVVTHSVDLSRFSGRRTVLAVWNIADTANAFYNCVDLNVGGGGGSPAPTPAPTPTAAPVPPSPSASTPPPPATGNAWAPGVSYKIGDVVTFKGVRYQCRQAHTSINSWEPSIFTLALWLPR